MDFSKLRDFVDYMAAKRSPGCAVKVCVNGQPVFEHAAGFSNLEEKIPMLQNRHGDGGGPAPGTGSLSP